MASSASMATFELESEGENGMNLELTEDDAEGAYLSEPLDSHTVQQLKWWLTCHGCKYQSTSRKPKLIASVREAQRIGKKVIDVDGTYLEKKRRKIMGDGETVHTSTPIPPLPVQGWVTLSPDTIPSLGDNFPSVSQGTLYSYLAEGVGNAKGKKAFRALKRGYVHYASGRVRNIEVNNRNTTYTFVKSATTPSMKPGTYQVIIVLRKEFLQQECVGRVTQALCDCAAGLSASCVHVSALLHALAGIKPSTVHEDLSDDSDDGNIPCTSKLCSWKAPKKRKEATLRMSEATFEKHEYGTTRKYKFDDIEHFDPRPDDLKGKANEYLPELLKKLDSKQLCLSLLFDETSQHSLEPPASKAEILEKVQKLKREKLSVTEEEIRKIEVETKGQHNSPRWFAVRRLRLTSSMFGHVCRLQDSTPPDNLVLQILGIKKVYGLALEYGRQTEEEARRTYTDYQIDNGHVGLFVSVCGFHIHPTHHFLGASPDGAVYDPSSTNPFGFLEIKCAYKYQDSEPREAAKKPDFWLKEMTNKSLVLKRNHVYYSQVQGHMACGNRPWCDFCTYTKKGIHVERIAYDPDLWEKELFPKLVRFYDSCIAPEIIAPQAALGLNIRDLRKE